MSCLFTLFVLQAGFGDLLERGSGLDIPHDTNRQDGNQSDDAPSRLHPERHRQRHATTVHQSWRITSDLRRPDGVLKKVYLINNAFPGPLLEARSGDRLVIEVENGLVDEDVAIHWHGLSMRGANDMDGAVGITQQAIRPGANFTYEFQIEDRQHGTFWYHAHSGVHRADGLYGGLVVHQPATDGAWGFTPAEHLLMVGDWYHRSAEQILDWYMDAASFGMEPVPDSMLVNGVGHFNCSHAVPARPLDCTTTGEGTAAALRLSSREQNVVRVVNVGSYASFSLGFDGGELLPIAVDGGNSLAADLYSTVGLLSPGERVDLLVKRGENSSQDAPEMRVFFDTSRFRYQNLALRPEQAFKVEWNGNMAPDQGNPVQAGAFDLQSANGDPISQADAIPAEADLQLVLYTMTEKLAHLDNAPHGFINHTTWQPADQPLNSQRPETWDKHQLVPHIPHRPDNPLWVDIVLNNLDEDAHPFHLHGYDFYVLSTYSSTFNWGSYNPFGGKQPPGGPYNLENPLKKDTVLVPRRGYAVLRFKADNPGIWMFHCHVLWHLVSGMAMAFEVS